MRREEYPRFSVGLHVIIRVLESERGSRRGSQYDSMVGRLSLLLMALKMKEGDYKVASKKLEKARKWIVLENPPKPLQRNAPLLTGF